jgi:hypothetical protein
MNQNKPKAPTQADIDRPLLPRLATPSGTAFQDAGTTPPSKAPLLLPPGNPEHNRELPYNEQDIDGYTIAEAHAALEAFKRNRHRKA